jgi:hypothetical protein
MDTTQETIEGQIGSTVSIMEVSRKANRDKMKQEIRAGQNIKEIMETLFASLAAKLDGWRKGMQADQEATKTMDLKGNPDEMESESEHREAPKEDAIVKPVKGWKKLHRGRKLAAGRCGEPKEIIRGDCGSGRKLAAACRKVSSSPRVAWRKGNIVRNKWTTAKDERGIWRVGMLRERVQMCHEGRKSVKELGGRRPLCLRKEMTAANGIGRWNSGQHSQPGSGGTLKNTLHQIFRGKIAKQVVGTSSRLWQIRNWRVWRAQPPPKRKENLLAALP